MSFQRSKKIADEFSIMVSGKIKYAGNLDGIKEKYRIIKMPLKDKTKPSSERCLAVAKDKQAIYDS